MLKKDWEKRWEKYGKELASTIHQNQKTEKEWLSHFLQSSVLLTNLLLPSIASFVLEFPMKFDNFDEKMFIKKLNKTKKDEVHQVIKIFLMDYFSSFFEHPTHALLLEQSQIDKRTLENHFLKGLFFTKEEKTLYEEMKEKNETVFPTVTLLKAMHVGKDANNQALVEGVEMFKEEAFHRLDKNFQNFYTQHKKDE